MPFEILNRQISPKQLNLLKTAALILLSALLLRLARPGSDYWLLAWVSFVPLLLASDKKTPLGAGWLAIICLSLGNFSGFFWIEHLSENFLNISPPWNYLFTAVYSVYLSIPMGFVFFSYRLITTYTKIPHYIVLATVFSALWQLFPLIFNYSFAETQIPFPQALQGISITGSIGLDFIILLVNGLVFSFISGQYGKNPYLLGGAIMVLGLWFGYGFFAYENWQTKLKSWPEAKLGLVQPNRETSFSTTAAEKGFSLQKPRELVKTTRLAKQGASFVIWPEGVNYSYSTNPSVRGSFRSEIKKAGTNLILSEIYSQYEDNAIASYNAMLWVKPDGSEGQPYFKRVLVPFGEYIPAANLLNPLLKVFAPHLPNLKAGKDFVYFRDQGITVIPVICYESLFPYYLAQAANTAPTGRLMVVGSQDGWYDSKHQVYEHSYISMLRAIENRVPLLHVVQNGFSSWISPAGDVHIITDYKTAAAKIVNLPLEQNSQLSLFTKYPYAFIITIRLICLCFFITAVAKMAGLARTKNSHKT